MRWAFLILSAAGVRGGCTSVWNPGTSGEPLGCDSPSTCTALLPASVKDSGATLRLTQRLCFLPDGSNDPACCVSSAQCAAWAGSEAQSVCLESGTIQVPLHLHGSASDSIVSVSGRQLSLTAGVDHTLGVIHAPRWTAIALDGKLLGNSTTPVGTTYMLRISLGTAKGSAPSISFNLAPPGRGHARGHAVPFNPLQGTCCPL